MVRRLLIAAVVLLGCLGLSTVPESGWEPPDLADRAPFAWDQDDVWTGLQARFEASRDAGCASVEPAIDAGLGSVATLLEGLDAAPPSDPRLDAIETALFEAAALTAACPSRLDALLESHRLVRANAKRLSIAWDPADVASRDRLYRLLYGGRMAIEEVLLQVPVGAAPTLVMGTDEPSAAPSALIRGLRVHSGDLLVSRGSAPTSAFIARGNTHPGNFSHVSLVHVADDATVSIIESHIESGVGVFPLETYLGDGKLRILVLRPRADLHAMVANPMLAHEAAEAALAQTTQEHIPYDFSMNAIDGDSQFCSEVAIQGYQAVGMTLWPGRRPLAARGATRWLADVGVRYFEVPMPADLEYDPALRVVAEWRDAETLFTGHIDNAILDALLERAEAGESLTANRWKLPPARLAKAASWVLNRGGRVGPIPEGMSATTALKIQDLRERHARMRSQVLISVEAFRSENGYTPPYWALVEMAREAA
jgi:hypothetical protein